MTFGTAFNKLLENKNLGMRLPQWKDDVIIKIYYPTSSDTMTAPYLYVESRFGKVPWKETMIELFSDKWEVKEV